MRSIKEAFVCAGWNLYSLRKNPRFYMSLLLGFLLCWLLSKKRHGWLGAAFILFALDTVALAVCTFTIVAEPASNIVDFFFHAWVLWALLQGFLASGKLKKLPPENAVVGPEDYTNLRPGLDDEQYIP